MTLLRAFVRLLEAAQLDRVGRLRRARVLQPASRCSAGGSAAATRSSRSWARGAGRTLDVGCGSSVILQIINDVVGLDIRHNKLRYMRRYDVPLVRGSVFALPVRDASFDCVVCSQVIEHIPYDDEHLHRAPPRAAARAAC